MAKKLKISGVIVPNDYKQYYDALDLDSTTPEDAERAIANAKGEELLVEINSPGGDIAAGSDIYTRLRDYGKTRIRIFGEASSAASVIAMAGHSEMSPTATMVVHCVSTKVSGNHNTMEHTAEMLRAADRALCSAYMAKTGMSEEEALNMMETETLIPAKRAKELGLVDDIMFEEESCCAPMTACVFQLPTEEQMEAARELLKYRKRPADILRAKHHFLNLKGVIHHDV